MVGDMAEKMQRIDKILKHDLFIESLSRTMEAERNRKFCRHDLEHALDVARISCMIDREEEIGLDKELVYAAALLHDVGRYQEYEGVAGHERAAGQIAARILPQCGFDPAEREQIIRAVEEHKKAGTAEERSLAGVLYRADKASRLCFACGAKEECKWKDSKKNMCIVY